MTTGQYRITVDIPGHLAKQAAWLMEQAGRTGVLFKGVIVEEEQGNDGKDKTISRTSAKQRKQ